MQKVISLFLSLCLIFIEFSFVHTKEKPILAVLPLETRNINKDEALIITDLLQQEIFNLGRYKLVERSHVDEVLREYQNQQSGICDIKCAVEIGKQLAANTIVMGFIGKLGDFYTIQAKLVDIERNEIENMQTIRAECRLGDLPNYIEDLVDKLIVSPPEVELKVKPKLKEEKKNPTVKTSPPREEKPKKKGKNIIFVMAGLAVAGVVVALLLSKKGNGEGTTASGSSFGSIWVNSNPTGAKVYLDGQDTGKTTNTTLTNVSPGNHTVKLIKEGYIDWQASVSVAANQTAAVNANFSKHTITIASPKSSTIWAKGDNVEIKWTYNGSSSSRVNMGINPQRNPTLIRRNNFPNSFQRRRFKSNLPSRDIKRQRSEFMEISTLEDKGRISRESPKSYQFLEKVPETRYNTDNQQQSSNNTISQINTPQIFAPRGNVKITTLSKVKIELYKEDISVLTIKPSTDNNGSYKWTLPTNLPDGLNYRIRISCASESEIYGISDTFGITHGYEFERTWGGYGIGNYQFYYPFGIAVDMSGNVYVADSSNHRIMKFSSNGRFIQKWGSYGIGNYQFWHPRGIAVDNSGNIYVSDSSNHRIMKFSSNGRFIQKWGSFGSGNYQFYYPFGITVDNSGNVFVVDSSNHRIMKFSSNGRFIQKWGRSGSGNNQFYYPHGIAVDKLGNIYVADTDNHRIMKFSSNGRFIQKWGGYGNGNSQFNEPYGITTDRTGNVYVDDTENYRIQKFDSNGKFIIKWGSYGIGNGQFIEPCAIATDEDGNVYVVDTDNHRIQKFRPIGLSQLIGKD